MDIKNKGCVVTGAGSGIGRGIALALVDAGAQGVIIADVQLERAQAVCGEIEAMGGKALPFRCDVRRADSVEQLAEFAWRELGHVEILCNNAGVINTGAGFDTSDDDLRWQFEVNVYGVFNGCRAFGRRFLESDERAWICNTASHHAVGTPTKGVATYVATKHAVLGFSDAFRLEYGERIGFSVLCPGIINTELWDAGRNRPQELGSAFIGSEQNHSALQAYGMSPEMVGQLVASGIQQEEFLIWTHPYSSELVESRYTECRDSIQRQWPDGPQPFHKRTPSKV
ncbi:MAG: SDR family NAD(P)-dependent oxidoreductase [Pseudomonas sp.]|uniref:SDR family NAD(P)-dependent oxidoreductase n=1 Tax=Pseudomonas sp. TaxID=306 RepID=UPI003982CFE8